MDIAQFEALKQVYVAGEKSNSINGDYKWKTKKGRFVPSNLDGSRYCLEQLIVRGVVSPSVWFSDAGAGDYRVVSISAAIGIPSIGVEYDGKLVQIGEGYIKQLREFGIPNGTQLVVAQGDFTKDRTYQRHGLRFEDIGVFFNFLNNEDKIAKKIAKQSPIGTWFVLETLWGIHAQNFKGLEFVGKIDANTQQGLWRDIHLYRKI